MKSVLILLLLVFAACTQNKKQDVFDTSKQDVQAIEKEIADFHLALKKAYNHEGLNTDSLIDAYFDPQAYYVTYWGTSEPIDTMKLRIRNSLPHVSNYDNQYESLQVKSYGDGAYAFFILRQDYSVDGKPIEEYLPTTFVFERRGDRWVIVHAQRTSDYETIRQFLSLNQSSKGEQSSTQTK